MSTEIVQPEDPFSTYKQARDDAFTKVSDFGSYFVGVLGRIESDALMREQGHMRRMAEASQQLSIVTGEKNALLEQVDMLQRRLESKTPDPETVEELTRVRTELDIARSESRRISRELREMSADQARVTQERDDARSALKRLSDSVGSDDLQGQIADLRERLEEARDAGTEAVTAAEQAVREAEEKADRRIAKIRENSAKELEAAQDAVEQRVREALREAGPDTTELEGLRSDLAAKDAEIAGLRALGVQSGESASALAVSTLHAMVLENPQLPASRALGLMAAALGQEAPQLPADMPSYDPPEAKPDLFQMPATPAMETQPAPEISPEVAHALDDLAAPSLVMQPAPAFDMQPAPSFETQAAPVLDTQQAPAFAAAQPEDPMGGFFDGPGSQPGWTPPAQDAPLTAEFFTTAPPAGIQPAQDAPLTADFFATAPPVQAA